jgi:hypothetical protein
LDYGLWIADFKNDLPVFFSLRTFAPLRESYVEISNFRCGIQNPKSKIQNPLGFPDFPYSCII